MKMTAEDAAGTKMVAGNYVLVLYFGGQMFALIFCPIAIRQRIIIRNCLPLCGQTVYNGFVTVLLLKTSGWVEGLLNVDLFAFGPIKVTQLS